MAGLSYDSAALSGIGHATHTHAGPTWIGERDGSRTKRLDQLFTALSRSGLKPVIVDDIVGFIWDKWVLNSAINAVAAITGLRLGSTVGRSTTSRPCSSTSRPASGPRSMR
jgi:2-dehydropantoate 2-reductase